MSRTYILQSEKISEYYVGSCESITERISQHNARQVKSTKSGVPWKLVYIEQFDFRSKAHRRELQIKSWKSRSAIEKLVRTFQNLKKIEDSR